MVDGQNARNALVEVQGLTVTYDDIKVVVNVDLDLFAGEIHAISGENGAGKSTVAKAIAGVARPASGSISIAGHHVNFANPKEALAHGVALIHQEPLIFPDLDIAENIFVGHMPQKGGKVDWSALYRDARNILQSLGLNLDPHAEVGGLSVAKQQMVELCCAMSQHARVWIFDETTAPLTRHEVEELFKVMRSLRDQGNALAIVTHHMDEIWEVADRITVLRDGRKVVETTPADSTVDQVVSWMVGRDVESVSKREARVNQETVLETTNLSGDGFSNISISLKRGQIVALAGLVGAGRSEFAEALFGIRRSTHGSFQCLGHDSPFSHPRLAVRAGLALVPEDRQHQGLFRPQSVEFNTTSAWLTQLATRGWIRPKDLSGATKTVTSQTRLVAQSQQQPVAELSGGNQQKVVVSKWLLTDPQILILDEPTRGVDVAAKADIHRLIIAKAEEGRAVLLVSSDLPEILALADIIHVMRGGSIVATLDGRTATENQIMRHATGQGDSGAA